MPAIDKLRKKLYDANLDGYLIPMRDEYGCEYVPPHLNRLRHITGFTGSAGAAVVLRESAAFFTDGRYTLQAAKEVSKEFTLLDSTEVQEATWIAESLKRNARLGFDPRLISISSHRALKRTLDEKGIKLVELDKNLIDDIWSERPKPRTPEAFTFPKKFHGRRASRKIESICGKMKGDYLLLTSPESICWLLNIRGNDLPNTPVILCQALLASNGEIYLYGDIPSIQKIENSMEADIHLRKASDIFADLKSCTGKCIELDPSSAAIKFRTQLEKSNCTIIESADPCLLARAIKNKTELENWRNSHIRDGAALTSFLHWLSEMKEKHDEYTLGEKLEQFRAAGENFKGLSFDSIIGFKSNGAIIHYRADKATAARISGSGILLIDSGAQYLDGTTDVTRTIAIGTPTKEQKRSFTLVLKGHIALASQKFLKGTSGANLDILARAALWREGLDYKHGTGHGVGYFLNVHEGPCGISRINNTPLQAGMVVSNEPGYYEKGAYGIRIESLVAVRESAEKGFLEFETLTKAPIDRNLIEKSLLTAQEVDWLNKYHDDVYNSLIPLLSKSQKEWLKAATKKL